MPRYMSFIFHLLNMQSANVNCYFRLDLNVGASKNRVMDCIDVQISFQNFRLNEPFIHTCLSTSFAIYKDDFEGLNISPASAFLFMQSIQLS